MVSTIYQVSDVDALSENNGSQNKNIGDNGGGPANCPEISANRLREKISGILLFNWKIVSMQGSGSLALAGFQSFFSALEDEVAESSSRTDSRVRAIIYKMISLLLVTI